MAKTFANPFLICTTGGNDDSKFALCVSVATVLSTHNRVLPVIVALGIGERFEQVSMRTIHVADLRNGLSPRREALKQPRSLLNKRVAKSRNDRLRGNRSACK